MLGMDEEMNRIRAMKTELRNAITSSLNRLSTDEVARQCPLQLLKYNPIH